MPLSKVSLKLSCKPEGCNKVFSKPCLLQAEKPLLSAFLYRRCTPALWSLLWPFSWPTPTGPCLSSTDDSRAGHSTPGVVLPEWSTRTFTTNQTQSEKNLGSLISVLFLFFISRMRMIWDKFLTLFLLWQSWNIWLLGCFAMGEHFWAFNCLFNSFSRITDVNSSQAWPQLPG